MKEVTCQFEDSGQLADSDCILDVRVTDTAAKAYCKLAPYKLLKSQEQRRNESASGHAWRIAVTSHLLCSQWTDYSDEKLKPSRNVSQSNLQERGRSPICTYADT